MEIKNIILDFGGVILNIDYHKTIHAFKRLGIQNFDQIYAQAKQNELFDDFEIGKIDSSTFLKELSHHINGSCSLEDIRAAWNAMLLDLPKNRLDFLVDLKKEYNTTLLSNTNQIHIEKFHQIIRNENGIDTLDPYFDHVHFSSDLGIRKPSPDTFTHVCHLHDYKPHETLFIDDSIQHVEGAQKAGLHAYHLDTRSSNIIQLLPPLLA